MWQKNALSLSVLQSWLAACEDAEVVRRASYGDQSVLSIVLTNYSLSCGLKLPYVQIANLGYTALNGLKDPSAFFALFEERAASKDNRTTQRPRFLGQAEQYPECSLGLSQAPSQAHTLQLREPLGLQLGRPGPGGVEC